MIDKTPEIANEPLCQRIRSSQVKSANRASYKRADSALYGRSCTFSFIKSCNCPDVLVCDDEQFQHFYYVTLFASMDFDQLGIKKESFKLEMCFSGTELLQKYQKYSKCGCAKPFLVISDFNMGPDSITGVSTLKSLRELGFIGPSILRTSDKLEDIKLVNPEVEELLKKGVITSYLEKLEIAKGKKAIFSFLKNCFKPL